MSGQDLLSVRGDGRCTIVVDGVRKDFKNPDLVGVLAEAARFQGLEVPGPPPGPLALAERITELERICDAALADHQAMVTECVKLEGSLRESDILYRALEETNQKLRGENETTSRLLAEAEAANIVLTTELETLRPSGRGQV